MALTDEQKQKVRRWLGYSGRFRDLDTLLEQAMRSVDSFTATGDDHAQTQLLQHIADIEEIETKIEGAIPRLKYTSLGNGELSYSPREMGELKRLGRMHIGRLSALLGVPIRVDVFAGHGPARMINHG